MKKPLLFRVSRYSMLFTFMFLCSLTFAQQKNLKTRSDNPRATQRVTGHNNLRKLTKIYDQKTGSAQKPSVGDDAQLRRLYEVEILKDPATGKIPDGIQEKELQFAKRLQARYGQKSGRSNGRVISDWSPRGPYNVGGRTRALALDLDNENIILAGGVSGGMWRSEDGGLTWTKTTGSNEHQSVTSVVQDPREGQHHVWYYATGERIGNSASASGAFYTGNGIYKSIDGGRTWNILPATADDLPQVNAPFDLIFNLAVHPTTGHLFVATWMGIRKSVDGGNTFEVALPGYPDNWTDVLVTPGGVLYASFESYGDPTSNKGIFRSTDGVDWENITPSGFPQTGFSEFGRTVLAYTPSDENVIYVFADNFITGGGYLWRYEHADTTATWTDLTANLPAFGGNVGNLNTQGGYNMVVKVHPTEPNTVFIGGTNLYRSTNGFTSPATTRWIGGYSPLNDVSIYPNQHPDQHALVFYPSDPDQALSGNDGGVHYTQDITMNSAGTYPVSWISRNNGYLTTQPYTVSIVPIGTGEQLVAGFQDNGTWFTSSSSLTTPWTEEFGGDGSYNALADSGRTRYISSQFGNIYRLEYPSPNSPSEDYIAFTRITPAGATGFGFIAPFILDPNDDNVMYLPAGRTIWRNDDLDQIPPFSLAPATVNWTNLTSTEVPVNNTITALGVSRLTANRLYYGTNRGLIYRVDNANVGNPTKVDIATGKGLPAGNVICITVDPADADRVFVVFSNYNIPSIFYSGNGGDTWTNISGNLEENPSGLGSGPSVRWLAIEGNSDRYYVGTSTGLYAAETLSGSATVWTKEDVDGIGAVVVPMVKTRDDGFVAVAAHGNGLYSAKFEVSPLPLPTLKIAHPIDNFEVFVNSPEMVIDISNVFIDTDGDPISYSLINTNPSLIGATLEENYLVLTFAPDATGTGTIGLVANAGDETLAEPFTITVRNLEHVLYNQNIAPLAERPSQLFTDFGNALAQIADDFQVPEGQTWTIEKVFAPGAVNGAPILNASRIVVYHDSAGRPGQEVYTSPVIVPASGVSNSNLELVLPEELTLHDGHYWISVYVELAYGTGNQWFWNTTDEVTGEEAHFKDENDLFETGALDWTPLSVTFSDPPSDMMFILFGTGTGIPAPSPPSNLTVASVSPTEFELLWKDNSDNELGFIIERSNNGVSFVHRATTGANDTSYSDTQFFNPELTYYYRVAAIGMSDTSAYSNVAYTALAPKVPVAKLASFVYPNSFVANWEAVAGAIYYELDVFTTKDSVFLPGYNGKTVFGTSYLVHGTHPSKRYLYHVRAVNAGGESENSNVIRVAPIKNLTFRSVCSDNPSVYRRWKVINGNPFDVEVEWHVLGTSQTGAHTASPGESFFTTNTVMGNNKTVLAWSDDKGITRVSVKTSTYHPCPSGTEIASGRGYETYEEFDEESEFMVDVYPNPAKDKFNVLIASPMDGEVEMEILTITGKVLRAEKAWSNTIIEIDASSYPSGAYLLKAKQSMFSGTLKVIKQ